MIQRCCHQGCTPEAMSPESVRRIVTRLVEEGVEIQGPIITPPDQ